MDFNTVQQIITILANIATVFIVLSAAVKHGADIIRKSAETQAAINMIQQTLTNLKESIVRSNEGIKIELESMNRRIDALRQDSNIHAERILRIDEDIRSLQKDRDQLVYTRKQEKNEKLN